ncbi:MAG: DUF3488 and DUF4129 domain-containing transglutaminase family protein [Planctomycetota bacterium]
MSDRLHPLLLLLTLFDLGFVHATGAVSATLLLPLWALALASPRLRRLQRLATYRAGWNVGVLIVFALLVHHATTTGLLHMLEDGLVLAVLCQVHLLNNIGDRQRPDLTFFNSFLIAFVTSFFAPDVWWSLLFAGHTLVFVPALQVYVLTARSRAVDAATMRAVLRDSAPRTVAIAALTGAVFVLWPRDFQRAGWLEDHLAFGQQLQSGMTERIDLDNETAAHLGEEIALRIEAPQHLLGAVPTHWRAIAFSEFDGRTWYPQEAGRLGSRFASDSPWDRHRDGSWWRPSRGDVHTTLTVKQYDKASERLATPLVAVQVTPQGMAGAILDPKSFAGFAVVQVDGAPAGPLTYTVGLAQPKAAPRIDARTRRHFTALPSDGMPRLARDLAARLRQQAPDADALTFARAAAAWLQENRRYELPGGPGFAGNLGEFLLGSAAGHCEYFATALALLLRSQDVPCRLVGGYLVHERSEQGDAMIARSRDAHAWVEVLAPDGSWHTFDATPPADVRRRRDDDGGFWSETSRWLESVWAEVTGFDDEARARWLDAACTLPLRRPWTCGLVLVAIGGGWWLRRRRRATRPRAIVAFERAVAGARLALRPGETPRELLARATAAQLDPQRLDAIRAAAIEHERARYRG